MLNELKLAIVDVETTGGSCAYHRVIEIGIRRIEGGEPVASYSTLVNPECRIPPEIEALTGISNDEVADAPVFASIQQEVHDLLSECVFVAHNVRFDYGFIRNEFLRVNRTFSASCLCTVRLSRLLYPEYPHHDLSSLIARHELRCERRHRALDDADAVWGFLQCVRKTIEPVQLTQTLRQLLKTPALPPQLRPEDLNQLPSAPGVYIFHDQGGMPLYVGKSVNIRERVLSHFSSDHRSGKEMAICQRVNRIDARQTYGELGALLLESHLIRTLSPMFNRRSRAASVPAMVLRGQPDQEGYETVSLEEIEDLSLIDQCRILAVFRTKRQAKEFLRETAREYKLCPKLLGLEPLKGTCLHAQLGLCSGACLGRIRAALYNAKVLEAFHHRKIRPWPYPGPIVIDEPNVQRSEGHLFVIDQWRVLRALAYAEDGQRELPAVRDTFDYEVYKILTVYLLKRPRTVKQVAGKELEQFFSEASTE